MEEELRERIKENEILEEDFELEHIRTGESNAVYRAGTNYIIKVSANDKIKSRLSREAQILEFLEDKPIHSPELVLFRDSTEIGPILIQETVGSRDIEFGELSEKQLRNLIQTLSDVHSVSLKDYRDFFNKEISLRISASRYFEQKIDERRKVWENYCSLSEESDRELKELYKQSLEEMRNVPDIDLELAFCHMDFICNMRAENGEIYLFDWELADLDLPEYSLVVQARRGRLEAEERNTLFETYYSFSTRDSIYDELKEKLWITFLLQDVLWAAETLEKEKEKDGDTERYSRKLRDRKRRLTHYLENSELRMEKMYGE